MDLDFIFANICGGNDLLVEKLRDGLVGLHSGAGNVKAALCIGEITMRFRKKGESVFFKNGTNPRRVSFVHGIDSQRQDNGNVLFACQLCKQCMLRTVRPATFITRAFLARTISDFQADASNVQQLENQKWYEQEKPS